MNKKETVESEHLTKEQITGYAKTIYTGFKHVDQIEGCGQTELLFIIGNERIVTSTDSDFKKAATGGIFGAYRELYLDGKMEIANSKLQIARNVKK